MQQSTISGGNVIPVRLQLSHEWFLSEENAHRITVRATIPTDRIGNTLVNGKSPLPHRQNEAPYFRRWIVAKEPKGFVFSEVNSGFGICGHHPTVRDLVMATLMIPGTGFVVEVAK